MYNNFREVLFDNLIRKEVEQEVKTEEVKDDTSIKYSIVDGRVMEPNLTINLDEEHGESIDHLATILSNMEKGDFIPQVLMYVEAGLIKQNRQEDFIKLVTAIQNKRDLRSASENKPVVNPSELGDPSVLFECLPIENKHPKKVVWEKYENVVEKQIDVSKRIRNSLFLTDNEESDVFAPYKDSAEKAIESLAAGQEEDDDEAASMFIPPNIMSDIRMMTIFDSWICYTNFDITKKVAERINSFTGVELFKVLTRYRFLLSISKAFEWKEFIKDFNQEFGINNEQQPEHN
jgi:hypothetical protein